MVDFKMSISEVFFKVFNSLVEMHNETNQNLQDSIFDQSKGTIIDNYR